jgi:hypothetical protein
MRIFPSLSWVTRIFVSSANISCRTSRAEPSLPETGRSLGNSGRGLEISQSQFESYRALGNFSACEALGQKRYSTIEELFNHVRDAVEERSPD